MEGHLRTSRLSLVGQDERRDSFGSRRHNLLVINRFSKSAFLHSRFSRTKSYQKPHKPFIPFPPALGLMKVCFSYRIPFFRAKGEIKHGREQIRAEQSKEREREREGGRGRERRNEQTDKAGYRTQRDAGRAGAGWLVGWLDGWMGGRDDGRDDGRMRGREGEREEQRA
jgi:hypothetical protein